ncbi:MAG: recombinase RecA [Planctomycetaceae bacterium]|nr:recombinase RecA [Planctomycetaceae bacterium]
MSSASTRIGTGVSRLDELLGGGLLPGTLTVVLGATGIGKTQLGIQFAAQGAREEGQRGVIFDMTARGDSQSHAEYAARMCDWSLRNFDGERLEPADVWNAARIRSDLAAPFAGAGRRVTTGELSEDERRAWKTDHNRKLQQTIAFFYGNFAHGVRRCVIDGVEPADSPRDSFQIELFEYIYQQILRKEHDWVARDLFRVQYRENEPRVQRHAYDHRQVACVLLCTTHDVMLDALLSRPLQSGDVLSNANTIILMGKTRDGSKLGRSLCVAKHRGSACDESIVPFEITAAGLQLAAG